MSPMSDCPCCSNRLLRQVSHNHIYWFCPRCRQEMPSLEPVLAHSQPEFQHLTLLNRFFPEEKLMVTE